MNKHHARQHVSEMMKLRATITGVLKSNPEKVKACQAGDSAALESLVQEVTKNTDVRPEIVERMVIERVQ